jgi:hippurate hydrolase
VAFGGDQVIYSGPSFLASEGFALMLQKNKGAYCFLGGGPGKMAHHPE